jgi:hypothetical protein
MTGLLTGAGVFGTIGSGFTLYERSGGWIAPDGLPLLFGAAALSGLGAAARKCWILTHPKKTPEKPTLAKVTQSLKNGVLGHGVSFSLGYAALAASDIFFPQRVSFWHLRSGTSLHRTTILSRLSLDNLTLVCAGSAILGLGNAARTYWSLSQPAPKPSHALPAKDQKTPDTDNKAVTPSNDPKKVQLTTANKIAASLVVGMAGSGVTFTLGMLGLALLDTVVRGIPYQQRYRLLMNVANLSLVIGLISYQSVYNTLSKGIEVTPGPPGGGKPAEKAPPGPTLSERWNGMSKTKRRRMIAVSTFALAALGLLYVGQKKSKIIEKISDAAQGVSDLHEKLAYTTKTKTESKTVREWIDGYTDQEEMKRLAALPLTDFYCAPTAPDNCRDVIAATCAEILNTCDIPEDDVKAHKKVYLKKSLKFGADKNPTMKVVANKAQAALNYAQELMKKERICGGGEDACFNLAAIWTLREPNWLYKKLGVESDCQIVFEGGDPEKHSPEDCSHVI